MLWIVIPLRGFASGKSRLAAVLDQSERAALNRRLFERTTACAVDAVGLGRILIVSPDDAVINAAATLGLHTVQEPEGAGLNAALALGRQEAGHHGATGIFNLSCDLPLLSAGDIVQACQSWSAGETMLIAPDEHGAGTNALILPVASAFPYDMGPESMVRHCATARRLGLAVVELRCDGLSFDLDHPADYQRWQTMIGIAA